MLVDDADFMVIIKELENFPIGNKSIKFEKFDKYKNYFKITAIGRKGTFNIFIYDDNLYIHYRHYLVSIDYDDKRYTKELNYLINKVIAMYLTYIVRLKD